MNQRLGSARRGAKRSGSVCRDLHPARLLELCRTARLARSIVLLDTAPSTNAASLSSGAAGAPEGLVFVAEAQTHGRGRKGRTWFAGRGTGLAFSLLLRPKRAEHGLTALFALAAVRALHRTAPGIGIKWPNDLYLRGRKVGGILAEARDGLVVIGMGLNVNERREDFPAEIADEAISLRIAVGRELDRGRILSRILESFERLYERFEREGVGAFRAEIESVLLFRGDEVRVEVGDGELRGRILGLTEEAYLRLAVGGAERVLSSGDVTVRRSKRGIGSRAR